MEEAINNQSPDYLKNKKKIDKAYEQAFYKRENPNNLKRMKLCLISLNVQISAK